MAKRLQPDIAPDLAGVHATRLSITIEFPRAEIDVVLRHLGVDKASARQTVFLVNYTRARKRHQGFALLHIGSGTQTSCGIAVLYDLQPVKVEQETRPLADLFEALTAADMRVEAECVADFAYPGNAWSSIIALPWRPLEMPGLPFDELRGFRAVKKRNGDVLYSLIVDRPTDEDISHSMTYSYPARLDTGLSKTLLERAVEISRLFVLPRPTADPGGRHNDRK